MLFATTQRVNLPVCSPHCLFNAERQAGKEAVNTYYKISGLTRLRIKSEPTAPEAQAVTTQQSELKLHQCVLTSQPL